MSNIFHQSGRDLTENNYNSLQIGFETTFKFMLKTKECTFLKLVCTDKIYKVQSRYALILKTLHSTRAIKFLKIILST